MKKIKLIEHYLIKITKKKLKIGQAIALACVPKALKQRDLTHALGLFYIYIHPHIIHFFFFFRRDRIITNDMLSIGKGC
jgi:hypothetical protein